MSSAELQPPAELLAERLGREIRHVADHARHAHARRRRAAGAVVVPALPVGIGGDGVPRDRVPRHTLRLQRVRARDRDDRVHLIRIEHRPLERLHPPSEPPATAASRAMPSSSRSARCARTMSATVMTGKSDAVRAGQSRGWSTIGPVVPRQPPSRFVLTTKKRWVSKALPGPIMPSHQPRPAAAAAVALLAPGTRRGCSPPPGTRASRRRAHRR